MPAIPTTANVRMDIKGRHLCDGRLTDGSWCASIARVDVGDKKYCHKHQEQLSLDLKNYREYQEVTLGGVIAPWTDEQLRDRERELIGGRIDWCGDLHSVRLEAETTAITRELERRRVGAR